MVGVSPRHLNRQKLFALVLCLLALVFAFEAKMAWYLPAHTAGSEVQAAKALPADTPQPIAHGLPGQLALFFLLPIAILFGLADIRASRSETCFGESQTDRSPSVSSAFSPGNFFRPPPVR